jgi:diguanylate cyclase
VKFSLFGSAFSFVLIDVCLALIALVVGFVSALWYTKIIGHSRADGDAEDGSHRDREAQINDAERANMAAIQLRDLAHNMATDVGEHNTLVGQITGQLAALPNEETVDNSRVVAEAITQIVAANEKLQGRLVDAESKIQTQAEEIRSQQSEARTDALTHMANRRAFDDALAQGVSEFQAAKQPCSLLIFDVDHFKKFNDTHGHQAGDEVLRSVGRTMKQVVKSGDLPCRYGGEEFAVVMRGTRVTEGRIVAERVRKSIEAMRVQFEGKTLKVSASIGLAELLVGEDSAQLIRRADDAVYTAKEGGRNCGYWHNGQQFLPMEDSGPVSASASAAGTSVSDDRSAVVTLRELPDQSVFSEELQRRISESHRFGVPLSLIYLQVKDYQELENEYGNAVGAMLLESVAQFTRSSLREMDLLGKHELGTFVVMLPGSSESEAKLVGKRVQTAIADCAIPLRGEPLSLEIQWGVAIVTPDDDVKRMMARARQAMEEAIETEHPHSQPVLVS